MRCIPQRVNSFAGHGAAPLPESSWPLPVFQLEPVPHSVVKNRFSRAVRPSTRLIRHLDGGSYCETIDRDDKYCRSRLDRTRGSGGLPFGSVRGGPVVGLPAVVSAKGAIVPTAPLIPADLIAAMQEGRFEDARRALTALGEKANDADDRAYFAYLRGLAERLAGNRDDARETLRTALQAAPSTRWAAKIRFELAGDRAGRGQPGRRRGAGPGRGRATAGRRPQGPAGRGLSCLRRRCSSPDDPLVRPDPNAAYELLDQARELAKSPALRARFLFAMGRASLAASNSAAPIENFQSYLKDYPRGRRPLRGPASAGRGSAEIQSAPARAADLDRPGPGHRAARSRPSGQPAIAAIRATALYEIASTYGIPNPPDDTSLNLGVAGTRRFLAAAPAHPRAVRAAYSRSARRTWRAARRPRRSMRSRGSSRRTASRSRPTRPGATGPSCR